VSAASNALCGCDGGTDGGDAGRGASARPHASANASAAEVSAALIAGAVREGDGISRPRQWRREHPSSRAPLPMRGPFHQRAASRAPSSHRESVAYFSAPRKSSVAQRSNAFPRARQEGMPNSNGRRFCARAFSKENRRSPCTQRASSCRAGSRALRQERSAAPHPHPACASLPRAARSG
jgi:hypothetical protein